MSGGFDELLERVIDEIALSGETGLAIDGFKEFCRKWCLEDRTASQTGLSSSSGVNSSQTANAPGLSSESGSIGTLYPDNGPAKFENASALELRKSTALSQESFKSLQDKIWQWLTARDDIWVGKEREGNRLQLSEAELLAAERAQNPIASSGASQNNGGDQAPLRIWTSKNRVWQMIAGHPVDFKRLPVLEFSALSAIASCGPEGVLQTELVKMTGQDKRSLPRRTEALAEKGYIIKSTTLVQGHKTSLLTLKKFVDRNQAQKKPLFVGRQMQLDAFLDFVLLLLKPGESMMMDALYSRVPCKPNTWERKTVQRCLDRLEIIGLIRRFRGKVNISQHGARLVNSIKLQRLPTPEDRKMWLNPSTKHKEEFRKRLKSEHGIKDNQDDVTDAVEVDIPKSPPGDKQSSAVELVSGGQRNESQLKQGRAPWSPESFYTNFLFRQIQEAGPAGLSTMELRQKTYGQMYHRPVENMLSRISDDWERSQPPHLQHLSIIRDTFISNRVTHYVYRSYDNFASAAENGQVMWEAVRDPESKRAKAAPGGLDEYGFPAVNPADLVGSDGAASLTQCLESSLRGQKRRHEVTDPLLVHPDGHVTFEPTTKYRRNMDGSKIASTTEQKDKLSEQKELQQKIYQKQYREKRATEKMRKKREDRIRAHAEWLAQEELNAVREGRPPASIVRELIRHEQVISAPKEQVQTFHNADQIPEIPAVQAQSQSNKENGPDRAFRDPSSAQASPVEGDFSNSSIHSHCFASTGPIIHRDGEHTLPDLSSAVGLEQRVQRFEVSLNDRTRPGLHVDPPDTVPMERHRGRSKKTLVAVFRLPSKLKTLDWFLLEGLECPVSPQASPLLETDVSGADGQNASKTTKEPGSSTEEEDHDLSKDTAAGALPTFTAPELQDKLAIAQQQIHITSSSHKRPHDPPIQQSKQIKLQRKGAHSSEVDLAKVVLSRVKKRGRPSKHKRSLILKFQSPRLPELAPFLFSEPEGPQESISNNPSNGEALEDRHTGETATVAVASPDSDHPMLDRAQENDVMQMGDPDEPMPDCPMDEDIMQVDNDQPSSINASSAGPGLGAVTNEIPTDHFAWSFFQQTEPSAALKAPSVLLRNPFSVQQEATTPSALSISKKRRQSVSIKSSCPQSKRVRSDNSLNLIELVAAKLDNPLRDSEKWDNQPTPMNCTTTTDERETSLQQRSVEHDRDHANTTQAADVPTRDSPSGPLQRIITEQIQKPSDAVVDGHGTDDVKEYGMRQLRPNEAGVAQRQKFERKKRGVGLGRGSLAANRATIIIDIITKCGGAFGGDSEIVNPFREAWAAKNAGTGVADRDTIFKAMKYAIESGKLKREAFTFNDKFGMTVRRNLLLLPEHDSNSEAANQMRANIEKAYPTLYIPERAQEKQPEPKERKQFSRYKLIDNDAVVIPPDEIWVRDFHKKMMESKTITAARHRLQSQRGYSGQNSSRPLVAGKSERTTNEKRLLPRLKSIRRIQLEGVIAAEEVDQKQRNNRSNYASRREYDKALGVLGVALAESSRLPEKRGKKHAVYNTANGGYGVMQTLTSDNSQASHSKQSPEVSRIIELLGALTEEQRAELAQRLEENMAEKPPMWLQLLSSSEDAEQTLSTEARQTVQPAGSQTAAQSSPVNHARPHLTKLFGVPDSVQEEDDEFTHLLLKKSLHPGQTIFRGRDHKRSPSRRGRTAPKGSMQSPLRSVVNAESDTDSLVTEDLISPTSGLGSPFADSSWHVEPSTPTRRASTEQLPISPAKLAATIPVPGLGSQGTSENSRAGNDHGMAKNQSFALKAYKPEHYDKSINKVERPGRVLQGMQSFDPSTGTFSTYFPSKIEYQWNLVPLPQVNPKFRNVFSDDPRHIELLNAIDDAIDHNLYTPEESGLGGVQELDPEAKLLFEQLFEQCREDYEEAKAWKDEGYEMQMHTPHPHGNRVFINFDLAHEHITAASVGQAPEPASRYKPARRFTVYGDFYTPARGLAYAGDGGGTKEMQMETDTHNGLQPIKLPPYDDTIAVQPFEQVLRLPVQPQPATGAVSGKHSLFLADSFEQVEATGDQMPKGTGAVEKAKAAQSRPRTYVRGKNPQGNPECVITPDASKRLLYTCIMARTLAGTRSEPVFWPAIEKVFADYPNFDLVVFKKRWLLFPRYHSEYVQRTQKACEEAYLAAYKKKEVPTYDPQHPESYDWFAVVDWAEKSVHLDASQVELPWSMAEFNRRFTLAPMKKSRTDDDLRRDMHKDTSTIVFRTAALHDLDYSIHMGASQSKVKGPRENELELAKSWVRAVAATPPQQYNAQSASGKLSALDPKILKQAIDELHKNKVIAHTYGGRFRPGRNFHLGAAFQDSAGKTVKASKAFGKGLVSSTLEAAVAFKQELDAAFAETGSMLIPVASTTALMMVMSALASRDCITITMDMRIDNSDAPAPGSVSRWGFEIAKYQSKKLDRNLLLFPTAAVPTAEYVYGPGPAAEKAKKTPKPLYPPGDPPGRERVPLWRTLEGKLIKDLWDKAVAGTLQAAALRGGTTIQSAARTFQGFVEEWEIRLVLEWLAEVGAVEWDKGEFGHAKATEWWWSVIDTSEDKADATNEGLSADKGGDMAKKT